MRLSSTNEWGKLRSVVVGTATNANWPNNDPVFATEARTTTWKESPVPTGPVPDWIVDEANADLEGLSNILTSLGVEVHRPKDLDFPALGGMYNYCPRDRLIVYKDMVIDTAMMYPCRDIEIQALDFVTNAARVVYSMPKNAGLVLDAANILRLGDTWLYLVSKSGNLAALEWLRENITGVDIEECRFYGGVHIDSTITVLREGLVVLNSSRVNKQNCPHVFNGWDKIWVDDVTPQDFYQYPYASKWIALNMLSVSPDVVICDRHQTALIKQMEQRGLVVIPHELRHSRTLGGGFHCVTLDLVRE